MHASLKRNFHVMSAAEWLELLAPKPSGRG